MVDFRRHMTAEEIARSERREADQRQRWLGTFTAIDDQGSTYEKNPHLSPDLSCLCFGGYAEYRLDERFFQDCVYDRDARRAEYGFCFDAGGRNHRGIPGVRVTTPDFIEIVCRAVERRGELRLVDRSEFAREDGYWCCPEQVQARRWTASQRACDGCQAPVLTFEGDESGLKYCWKCWGPTRQIKRRKHHEQEQPRPDE